MKNKLLLFSILFSLTASVYADEGVSLYEQSLSKLNGGIDFEELNGKSSAMVIFQPDCAWCALQVRTIKKLQDEEGLSKNYIAVGINGRHMDLKKEMMKSGIKLPSYRSTPTFKRIAGLKDETPVILIVDGQGQILKKLVGYQDETVLKQIDQVLTQL